MAHTRPEVPRGHGELLLRPDYAEWRAMAERNADEAQRWGFAVAGSAAAEVRATARREACEAAAAFSARLGVPVRVADPAGPVVMTGHQPELYHPGVWVKDFLLQRLADDMTATAIDLVVDSDGFDRVAATVPCMRPETGRCTAVLAVASPGACYGCSPAPGASDVAAFRAVGAGALGTLPTPAIARHFAAFCDALDAALPEARSLAEAVTFARRRFEAPAGTDYLELPVTQECAGESFRLFFADVALSAGRFAEAYNGELAEHRRLTGARSAAQPFPDLARDGDTTELPFWALADGERRSVSVRTGGGVTVLAGGEPLAEAPARPDALADALARAGVRTVPKALALTLFNRVFVADLFIHGVGGGRYDAVTDGVVRRFYGVEPPRSTVASLTMYLPLGGRLVSAEEVEAAEQRVNALEHNPDRLVGEVAFDSDAERVRAESLAGRKKDLVARIAAPGADKKRLGVEIREVNAELGELLAPVREEALADRDRLAAQRAASDVLTDREYPFCLWSPQEVADKVR